MSTQSVTDLLRGTVSWDKVPVERQLTNNETSKTVCYAETNMQKTQGKKKFQEYKLKRGIHFLFLFLFLFTEHHIVYFS